MSRIPSGRPKNFAVVGVGGFVAPRHLKAIADTGNLVVAAADPNDSVGILDRFGFEIRFFREIERLDRHLDKLRRGAPEGRVDYVSVCSPNYLHDAHIRMALRNGADAICEKPLVITPWNLDALERIEEESGRRVYALLQLRVHPALIELRRRLHASPQSQRHNVELTYVTSRGRWYDVSWKGSDEHSGGVAMNIGIHFFDLLIWLFGDVRGVDVQHRDPRCYSGSLELEHADVSWFLSLDRNDLPDPGGAGGHRHTYRSIKVDGEELEFSEGFADLHTRVYEQCIAGTGFGIPEARPSIELVHRIRTLAIDAAGRTLHPFLRSRSTR